MRNTRSWTRRAAAAILTLTIAAGLGACGDKADGGAAGQSIEDIMKTAQANMADVKSMSYDMTMSMEMKANDETLKIATSGKVDQIVDPITMKLDMNVDMGEVGNMNTAMYVAQDGDKYMLYTGIDAGDGNLVWQKQEMADTSAFDQMDARESFDLYLSSAESFKENGTETVAGAEATRYDGTISEEDLAQVLEASGVMDQFSSLGITGDQLDTMLTDLGDLPISLWISKADQIPVKYEMDMTAIMQSLMGKMMDSMGAGEDDKLDVANVLVSMTVSNINGVESIEIPAEALNAAAA